jgi:hypothetical protein
MTQNTQPTTTDTTANYGFTFQKGLAIAGILVGTFVIAAQPDLVQTIIWTGLSVAIGKLVQDNSYGDLKGKGTLVQRIKHTPLLLGLTVLVLSFIYSMWLESTSMNEITMRPFIAAESLTNFLGNAGYWLAVFRVWMFMSRK